MESVSDEQFSSWSLCVVHLTVEQIFDDVVSNISQNVDTCMAKYQFALHVCNVHLTSSHWSAHPEGVINSCQQRQRNLPIYTDSLSHKIVIY